MNKKQLKEQVQIGTRTYSMHDLTLNIPEVIYQKIRYWMDKANFEVSGFGSLDWDASTKTFTVRDVILLKQEVGAASTEIDPVSLGRAMFRTKDEPNALKWHWHSHVDMGTFWSHDDMELINSLGVQGWILATVFNRKGDKKTAFMSRTDIMEYIHDVFFDDLETKIIPTPIPADLKALWDKEYDENVTVEPVRVYKPNEGNIIDHTGYREKEFVPRLFTVDFDENGFARVGYDKEDWVYNPAYDNNLKTELERFKEIDDMDWEEITYMRDANTKFAELLSRYLVWKAIKSDESEAELKELEKA